MVRGRTTVSRVISISEWRTIPLSDGSLKSARLLLGGSSSPLGPGGAEFGPTTSRQACSGSVTHTNDIGQEYSAVCAPVGGIEHREIRRRDEVGGATGKG